MEQGRLGEYKGKSLDEIQVEVNGQSVLLNFKGAVYDI
jgi:hypothetical protein